MAAHSYRMCGVTLGSSRPLAELRPGDASVAADITVAWRPDAPFDPRAAQGLTVDDGAEDDAFFVLTHDDGRYRLWFEDLALFEVDDAGSRVTCTPVPGHDGGALAHILLDQVLPRVIGLRGGFMLHGSAVRFDGGVVAFVGETGRGKSTLASAFLRAGRGLLADDCVRITGDEAPHVHASYPGLRLWPEHAAAVAPDPADGWSMGAYTEKRRYAAELGAPEGGLPLRRWYVLEGPPRGAGPCEIEPLSRRDAVLALLGARFRLDRGGGDAHASELDALASSQLLALGRRLRHAHDLADLPAVLESIAQDVR